VEVIQLLYITKVEFSDVRLRGDEELLYSVMGGVEPEDSGYSSPAMHFQFIPVLVNCSSNCAKVF